MSSERIEHLLTWKRYLKIQIKEIERQIEVFQEKRKEM
jgi:hypothetical protein